MLVVGGNLCVLWSLVHVCEATLWSSRAIRRGRAASGRRQTWVGGLRVVLAGGLGSEAWVARRLACGGGGDFKRGGHRRPARALLVDPSGRRLQTYAARAEPSYVVVDGSGTDPLLRHRRLSLSASHALSKT